jgi:THO complex subunit 1
VYIFLFQSFPLGDKSSVNLRGNFHTENVTTFDDISAIAEAKEDRMEVEPAETKEGVSESSQNDSSDANLPGSQRTAEDPLSAKDIDTLYPVFWSLQNAFSNPPSLFEEENFKHFQKSLEATVEKFKQVPPVATVAPTGDPDHEWGAGRRPDVNRDKLANTFNPKYLTSRDLFKLEVSSGWHAVTSCVTDVVQLSDLAFQRHILVQALVLIDFLLTLTERSKSRSNYIEAQKAMQYAFTLSEEKVSHDFRSCRLRPRLLAVPP